MISYRRTSYYMAPLIPSPYSTSKLASNLGTLLKTCDFCYCRLI